MKKKRTLLQRIRAAQKEVRKWPKEIRDALKLHAATKGGAK